MIPVSRRPEWSLRRIPRPAFCFVGRRSIRIVLFHRESAFEHSPTDTLSPTVSSRRADTVVCSVLLIDARNPLAIIFIKQLPCPTFKFSIVPRLRPKIAENPADFLLFHRDSTGIPADFPRTGGPFQFHPGSVWLRLQRRCSIHCCIMPHLRRG